MSDVDRLSLPADLSPDQRRKVEQLVAECGLARRPFGTGRRGGTVRYPRPAKEVSRETPRTP